LSSYVKAGLFTILFNVNATVSVLRYKLFSNPVIPSVLTIVGVIINVITGRLLVKISLLSKVILLIPVL